MKRFWLDKEIKRYFTNDEMLFYIYLLTNPSSNISGCYKIDFKIVGNDLGISRQAIDLYMERLAWKNKVLYNQDTEEILLMDCYKYRWNKDKDTTDEIEKEVEDIQDKKYKEYLADTFDKYVNGKIKMINLNIIEQKKAEKERKVNGVRALAQKIVPYLNQVCNTRYSSDSKIILNALSARMENGFINFEDYKTVIDKKASQWLGTDYEKYLRPQTLFGNKFESYLNERDKSYERRASKESRQKLEEAYINLWDSDIEN